MSALVQLALLSGFALCLALLLHRAGVNNNNNNNKDKTTEGSGHYPPMLHRKAAPDPGRGSGGQFSRSHHPEAIARAKGGSAAGGKSNLAGQIIPVYGFGILLYILYIIFKITSRGKTSRTPENRFPVTRSENLKRKITDFELTQLQDRLRETEDMMERIVSRAQAQHGSPHRVCPVSADQEEALLLQLREITRVMKEGRLLDEIPAEKENSDPGLHQDLEGFPERTEFSEEWHQHCCRYQHGEMDGDRQEGREDRGTPLDGERGRGCCDGGVCGEEEEELFEEVSPKPRPEDEELGPNTSHPDSGLIRRKTRNGLVRLT
ncbi:protein RIC-3b [Hoplias malabaricus]|uniref:protein RIC-3b n=1 Tax=Hoplias malabaricus TaxID=27720 RepID=UPI0034629CA5